MNEKHLVGLPVRCQDHRPCTLRFVPALNLTALRARPHEDKQLLLWYCLRCIDAAGRGVLGQEEAVNILRAGFGYQRQTAYKHLEVGDGIYWRRHTSRKGRAIIILHSLARVAQHLQANIRERDRFIEFPASDLPPSGQVQARRALLYNTGAYTPSRLGNHPISRRSLEEKTGIESRQQRRYDQVMEAQGPVREPTFAYYRDRNTFKLKRWMRLVETDKRLVLTHQLPNKYWTLHPGGSRGMLSKIARVLCVLNQSSMRGEATFTTNRRRYYQDTKSFVRAATKGEASDGFCPRRANRSQYVLETV